MSPDLSGKLSLWPQKYNLLVLLCPHKSTTCYFVPLDLQTCKIPHLRYIVAHGGTRQPKEKKTTCPKRHGGGFFYVLRFLYEILCTQLYQKRRARANVPRFWNFPNPLYLLVFAANRFAIFCCWNLRFFVAGKNSRKPFIYRGFRKNTPQKKVCDFLLLAKMAEIPLFIGVSDVFNPKKSLRFFVAGILLFFCR